MKILMITVLAVAVFGKPDVNELNIPSTNYGVPDGSVLTNTNNLFGYSLPQDTNIQFNGYPSFEGRSNFGVLQPQKFDSDSFGFSSTTSSPIGKAFGGSSDRSIEERTSFELSNAGPFNFGSSSATPISRTFGENFATAPQQGSSLGSFQSINVDSPNFGSSTSVPLLRAFEPSLSSSTISPLSKTELKQLSQYGASRLLRPLDSSSTVGFDVVTPSSIGIVSSTSVPNSFLNNIGDSNLNSFSLGSLNPTISNSGFSGLTSTVSPFENVGSINQNSLGALEARFGNLNGNSFNSYGDLNLGSIDGAQFPQLVGFDGASNFDNSGLNLNQDSEEGGHTLLQNVDDQGTQISKHLYFYEAPEEQEEEVRARQIIKLPPRQKTYKIIFIKAPAPPKLPSIEIPIPEQNDEKTLVYVLVKKPETQQEVNVRRVEQSKPSKPEVFFIRYKTREEAEKAIADAQSGNLAGGLSVSAKSIEGIHLLNSLSKNSNSGGFSTESRSSIPLDTSSKFNIQLPTFLNGPSSDISNIVLRHNDVLDGNIPSKVGTIVNELTGVVSSTGTSSGSIVPLQSSHGLAGIQHDSGSVDDVTESSNGSHDIFTSKTTDTETSSADPSTTTGSPTETTSTDDSN